MSEGALAKCLERRESAQMITLCLEFCRCSIYLVNGKVILGIVFSIEALKFHKLKEERFPRILFVILLAVNLFIAILSPGDRNFDALLQFLKRSDSTYWFQLND